MDRLTLRGMVFYAHHGVTEKERNLGGRFEVDCELWKDLKPTGITDDLSHGVDVRDVHELIRSIVLDHRFHTLEALAEKIAERTLGNCALERIIVRVRKPNPPSLGITNYVEVEIERKA